MDMSNSAMTNRYLMNGVVYCPYCLTKNIRGIGHAEVGGQEAKQDMGCNECGTLRKFVRTRGTYR